MTHFKENFFTRFLGQKNRLLLAILMASCSQNSLSANPAPEETTTEAIKQDTLCEKIATQNLFTVPRAEDPSLGDSVSDPYAFFTYLTETIAHPQAHDKRKRSFKILASAEKEKKEGTWTSETLLDATTWQDLNLLSGSKDNPAVSLSNQLCNNRTHTDIGKAYFSGMIARPTTDVELLKARQQIIKKLVVDEKLFEQLDKALQQVARHEVLFTGLWDAELLMQFIDNGYTKMDGIGPVLNSSPLFLELKHLIKMSSYSIGASIMIISPIVLTYYGISMLHSGQPGAKKLAAGCFGQLQMLFEFVPVLKNRWAQGSIALIMAAAAALSIKPMLQHFHTGFLFDDFLRKRLVHVAMYTALSEEIFGAMNTLAPELGSSFTFFEDIQGFFDNDVKNDPQLAQLDELLKSDTFEKGSEEKFSALFLHGNMLCSYYLLSKIKSKFEGLMAGIGELDAFMTIAKLIKESQASHGRFCFPSYVENAKTPAIELADFWNPFLDNNKVVLNSIELGEAHNLANLVVTGPNSAGKSTILKSIALSIILAQSIGIAPAQSMTLTPFAYVATYMNVADSIVDQESRFQAEARRVFEYGDRLEVLAQKQQFSFAIFDEIFSGTSPTEGAELGYKVASVLAQYPHCISIIATHFEKLTQLEKDTNKRFINYKIAVKTDTKGAICFDDNNKIQRLFKLHQGISHQHIAREVFKEKGTNNQSQFFDKCFAEKQ